MSAPIYKFKSTRVVDWSKVAKVEGVVTEKGVQKIEEEDREFITVDAGPIFYRVYKATDLAELFAQADKGDHVSIEFLETVQLKKGNRKLNRFAATLWTEGRAE